MSDIVFIKGLRPRAILGLNEWEREKPQELEIDIEMAHDIRAAAADEDIEKSVNYRAVAKAVMKHTVEGKYLLVETLAENLAKLIREEFGVAWVRLRIAKPGAVRFSDAVGVIIERGMRPPTPTA